MLNLLYEALASEYGKVIVTTDVQALQQALYRERARANDEALANLSLVPSPINPDEELWIVKKELK